MSTATATADAAPPAKGGKKKLIIILAAVLVLALGGGVAAYMLTKKHPVEAVDGEEDGAATATAEAGHGAAAKAHDPKHPPVFVPLEAFTVNLADKESDRYAQIGVTLEIEDPKTGEEMKVYMPAIRNNILMVLSNKTAAQLLSRQGKEKLARAILLAAVQPLGFQVDYLADDEATDEAAAADDETPKKKKKKKKAAAVAYPVTAVHFSTFIVQ